MTWHLALLYERGIRHSFWLGIDSGLFIRHFRQRQASYDRYKVNTNLLVLNNISLHKLRRWTQSFLIRHLHRPPPARLRQRSIFPRPQIPLWWRPQRHLPQGPAGQYADIAIDCDGANHSDGKCANDSIGQPGLAFDDDGRVMWWACATQMHMCIRMMCLDIREGVSHVSGRIRGQSHGAWWWLFVMPSLWAYGILFGLLILSLAFKLSSRSDPYAYELSAGDKQDFSSIMAFGVTPTEVKTPEKPLWQWDSCALVMMRL